MSIYNWMLLLSPCDLQQTKTIMRRGTKLGPFWSMYLQQWQFESKIKNQFTNVYKYFKLEQHGTWLSSLCKH